MLSIRVSMLSLTDYGLHSRFTIRNYVVVLLSWVLLFSYGL